MKFSKRLLIVLMVAVISTALIVLEKYKMPLNIFLWRYIFDAGHIPLFGVISIAFLGISQTLYARRFTNPLMHYIIAFVLTCLLGLITEVLQYFTPRDADLWDIISDGIGAICFLGLYLTFDRRLTGSGVVFGRKLKYLIRLAVVILGLVAMMPTINWIGAYLNRNNRFPIICNFESDWEQKFVFVNNASLSIVHSPEYFGDSIDNNYGRVDFNKTGHSNFKIVEPYPDWTGYDNFSFSIFSANSETIGINLQIKDRLYNKNIDDKFNQPLSINPGLNIINIPLEEVINAPKNRRIDIRKISLITLSLLRPINNCNIYLDNFRLE